MTRAGTESEPGGEERPPARGAVGWGAAGAAVFVALVICGWGIASLVTDQDVLPPGLPLWAGPTAVAISAVLVGFVARGAVRDRWRGGSPYDIAPALTAGFGAALMQGAVIAVFAAFGGDSEGVGSALLGVGLAHAVSVFGIVVFVAGALVVIVLQWLASRYTPTERQA